MNSQSAANVTECATQVSSGALWRMQITRNDNLPQLQVDGKPRWRMTPPSAARTHRRTGGKQFRRGPLDGRRGTKEAQTPFDLLYIESTSS